MKQYTKPTVVKVVLNPEQAVLGTCAAGVTKLKDSNANGYCTTGKGGCKQYNTQLTEHSAAAS